MKEVSVIAAPESRPLDSPAVIFEDISHETRRLNALYRYDVLDTPAEECFDRIARLAKCLLRVPVATISLVDRDRQWFKNHIGIAMKETPRDISFCGHAILNDEPMVIEDARKDARFAASPLVTGPPRIRFYCGVPLRTPEGFNVGTLCAIDTAPRKIEPGDLNLMRDLAQLVIDELELRRLASTDSQTGVMTQRRFHDEMRRAAAQVLRYKRPLGFIMFDIDRLKAINDSRGHAFGDMVMRTLLDACQDELRVADFIGRLGSDEFAIGLPETDMEGAASLAERVRRRCEMTVIPGLGPGHPITATFGTSELKAGDADWEAALTRADVAMQEGKRNGRNRVASSMTFDFAAAS